MLFPNNIKESNSPVVQNFPHQAAKSKRDKKWDCKLSETLIGEYLIVPLTSVKMLQSESYAMNNCCRQYRQQCAEMNYCIFSIRRRSGERLATLGLHYIEGYWRFDQCTGPSNSEVMEEIEGYFDENGKFQTELFATELYFVAQEVARLMNSGLPLSPHELVDYHMC